MLDKMKCTCPVHSNTSITALQFRASTGNPGEFEVKSHSRIISTDSMLKVSYGNK